MSFKKMDPSCTIGFYCETKAEFEKFRQQTTEVSSVNKHYYPKQDTAFFIKNILQHHQFVESLAELSEPIWIPSPVVMFAVIRPRATTFPQFMEQFCSLIKTKSPLCHYLFFHFHQVLNLPVPHHNALISLYIDTWPLDDPLAVIRTNSALCFMALDNDSVLHDHWIKLFLKSGESRIETRRFFNLNLNSFDRIPRVGQFSLLKCGKFLLVESGILVTIGISIQAPLTKNPESSTLMYKKRTLA